MVDETYVKKDIPVLLRPQFYTMELGENVLDRNKGVAIATFGEMILVHDKLSIRLF